MGSYWEDFFGKGVIRGEKPQSIEQPIVDESIANESIDFEDMTITELLEWLKDNLLNADDDEANSNNVNIVQETLYNKVAARDGSDYELMNAGNYLSSQGLSTPYSEDSEDSETPYVEGFQALPAGHD